MKTTCWMLTAMLTAAAALLAGTVPATAGDVPEIIAMDNLDYDEHTKPIVEFPHQRHTDAFPQKYPDFFSAGCGSCHHDDEGKALTDLAPGDDVNACIDCHSEPGKVPSDVKKQMREQKLSREEKKSWEREYHAEAVHDLCRGCHRKVRKADRSTSAPTSCMKCHTKDAS